MFLTRAALRQRSFLSPKIKAEDNFTERISRLVAQAKALEANKTEYVRMNLHDRDIIWHTKQEALKEGALQKALKPQRNFSPEIFL